LISAAVIVLLNGRRKVIFTLAAVVLPVALVGLIFLQQTRRVGFFDMQDSSINYRQTVYREGFNLWTAGARNFIFGVGMDSIKRYAKDWHLFDDGRLPMGHFHSTPLQLVVERGLPALLIWLTVLGIYARTLWRCLKARRSNRASDESKIQNLKSKIEFGIVLGCFGGLIGFFASGLVHYNLGDGEVAMVFYLLMGIGVYLSDRRETETANFEN
jgi:O-antigen ligase